MHTNVKSLCCTPGTNIILYFNYISIKEKGISPTDDPKNYFIIFSLIIIKFCFPKLFKFEKIKSTLVNSSIILNYGVLVVNLKIIY